jgi:hypothetical protein
MNVSSIAVVASPSAAGSSHDLRTRPNRCTARTSMSIVPDFSGVPRPVRPPPHVLPWRTGHDPGSQRQRGGAGQSPLRVLPSSPPLHAATGIRPSPAAIPPCPANAARMLGADRGLLRIKLSIRTGSSRPKRTDTVAGTAEAVPAGVVSGCEI